MSDDSSETRAPLSSSAFIDPGGSNREEVERLAGRALKAALSSAATASHRSPLPDALWSRPLESIPSDGIDLSEIIHDLEELLANSMNAANPGYIGHMDSIPSLGSILGDLFASTVNNNMLSLEMSPAFSRLEPWVLSEFASLFGLGERAAGVLTSGGSLANLQALTVARNVFFRSLKDGIVGLDNRPVIFASPVAHASILKAAMILGLGTSSVVSVETTPDSRINIESLRHQIGAAKKSGAAPFCVVATAGTTVTGNIDPLQDVAEAAKDHGLWFHVDAAYGGALVFSPAQRHRLAGIEYADSVVFNPQKWLYIAKTCAMVLFKDGELLKKAFQVTAPYMRDTHEFVNLGEIGIQGTRRADIVKLWVALRHIGRNGFAHLIDRAYELTGYFIRQVRKRRYLELASEPETNIVCFRARPEGLPSTQLDDLNSRLQARLLSEGHIFLSLPLYRGDRWLRAVLLNPFTDQSVVDRLFKHMDAFVAEEARGLDIS